MFSLFCHFFAKPVASECKPSHQHHSFVEWKWLFIFSHLNPPKFHFQRDCIWLQLSLPSQGKLQHRLWFTATSFTWLKRRICAKQQLSSLNSRCLQGKKHEQHLKEKHSVVLIPFAPAHPEICTLALSMNLLEVYGREIICMVVIIFFLNGLWVRRWHKTNTLNLKVLIHMISSHCRS